MKKISLSAEASQQIEDFIGRTLLLVWFIAASYRQGAGVVQVLLDRGTTPTWLLDSFHHIVLLAFSVLAATLTIIRKPAKAVADGVEPRVSAILGTFLMLSLPLLPQTEISVELKVLSLLITTIGLVLTVYCLFWLGRSWSIMATARTLVTKGPYRVVRHPIYASELISMGGVALGYFSLPALLIVLATIAFTLRRTYNEERVLRAAFPEYADYARRVPRIIPKIRFSRVAGPAALATTPVAEATRRP